MWDGITGMEKATFHHGKMVKDIVFSADESHVVTGGFEKYLRLWDLERPDAAVMEFDKQNSPINYIVWNKLHNDMIVTSSLNDGAIRTWDSRSKELVREYKIEGSDETTSMVASKDGAFIIITTKSRVIFWNAKKYVHLYYENVLWYHINYIILKDDTIT